MVKKKHIQNKKNKRQDTQSIESETHSSIDSASFSSDRMEEKISKQVNKDMMRLAIKRNLSEPQEPTPLDCLVAAAKVHLRRIKSEKKKHKEKRIKSLENKENEEERNTQKRDKIKKEPGKRKIRRRNIHHVPILPDTQEFIENVNNTVFPYYVLNGEKISTCIFPGCTKSFPGSSRVKRHYKTHFKVHPYRCSYCGRTFGRKDNMMQHMTRCKNK